MTANRPTSPFLHLKRLAYRSAHRLLRAWWWLRRPVGRGAAVAVWNGGRLLVVRTSYRDTLDLPGGGVEAGEGAAAAALRELREETGIVLGAEALGLGVALRYVFEHRAIEAEVFAARLGAAPELRIDGGEIVWAGWLTRGELARASLNPTLAGYLAASFADGPAHSK